MLTIIGYSKLWRYESIDIYETLFSAGSHFKSERMFEESFMKVSADEQGHQYHSAL